MGNTCDPMVYEIAARLLMSSSGLGIRDLPQLESRTMSLACAIQQAAEDWIESERIDRTKAVEQQTLPMDGQGRR